MITYKVKSGENIWKILNRFGLERFVTSEDIMKANPMVKEPKLIQPGWELKLPSSYSEVKALRVYKGPGFPEPKLFKPMKEEVKEDWFPGVPEVVKVTLSPDYKYPEVIEEEAKLPSNLEFRQAPSVIQTFINKGVFKIKEFIKGEPTIVSALKNETSKSYPLTTFGKEKINQITTFPKWPSPLQEFLFYDKEPGGGAYWENEPLKMSEEFYNKLPDAKKRKLGLPVERFEGTITLSSPKASTMMHEALHSMFQTEVVNKGKTKAFQSAWEEAKKSYPWETAIVDDVLDTRYPSITRVGSRYLTHERFAWFGATFGKVGLQNFPEPLKPFYQVAFK